MEKELTFEQAMKRLEEITNTIQKNDCSIDEGLKLYQEGLELAKFCDNKLKSFSEKLNEITAQVENDEK